MTQCAACKKPTMTKQFVRWRKRRYCFDCCAKLGDTHGYKTLRRYLHKAFERQGKEVPDRKDEKLVATEPETPKRMPVFKEGDWVEVCGKRSDTPEALPHDEDFNGDVGYVRIVEGRTTREGPTYPFWYSVIFPTSYDGKIKNHGRQMEEKHLKSAREPKDGISETFIDGVKQ